MITREKKAKENVLMNSPCQMKVLYYSFTLDNFNNTEPPVAYRERFIGLNNRVLAGMLVYVERKNLRKCPSSRFDDIDATCSGGRDVSSYGVDPVFKLSPIMAPGNRRQPRPATSDRSCVHSFPAHIRSCSFRAAQHRAAPT